LAARRVVVEAWGPAVVGRALVLAPAQVAVGRAHRVPLPLRARLPVVVRAPLPVPAVRPVVGALAVLVARRPVVAGLVVVPAVRRLNRP
jgi:hypothetical protein